MNEALQGVTKHSKSTKTLLHGAVTRWSRDDHDNRLKTDGLLHKRLQKIRSALKRVETFCLALSRYVKKSLSHFLTTGRKL